MRLFIAIRFSPEIKSELIKVTDDLRSQARANFTRPENLHLTLAFIGESDRKGDISGIIDKTAPKPFDLSITGTGRFGSVYWAGIKADKVLFSFADSLRKELKANGIPVDTKPFSPHITLAREVVPFSEIKLEVKETQMRVERVSLMSSERIDGRLTYKEVYGKNL